MKEPPKECPDKTCIAYDGYEDGTWKCMSFRECHRLPEEVKCPYCNAEQVHTVECVACGKLFTPSGAIRCI